MGQIKKIKNKKRLSLIHPIHICFSLLFQGPGPCTAERCLWTAVYQESVCGSASPSLFWWRSKTFPLRKESLNTNPSLWTKRNYALIQEPSLHHSVIPSSSHSRPVAYHRFTPPSRRHRWSPFIVQTWNVMQMMWTTSVMPVGCLLMCVLDMLVVKWRVDDDVCDVRVTLSELFTSGPVGSRRRDPSWTVVHFDVRSYYEWCQTTCFLSSEEGRVISAPRLRSFGLSTQSKRLTRVQPSYCPQSVHHSDRRSFTLSVNIYAVEAPHSSGKNYISHQPLCFSLSARRILLPLSHDGMIVFTRFTTELSLLAENHWYWS